MHKNKGQSIIEYAALAMLIIVGTIVMGPYVIRSIGAHFKLWQETVDDSVNDRMKTLPITIYQSCKPTGYQSSGCGAPLKGAGMCTDPGHTFTNTVDQKNCAPNERYWFQTGVPDGCHYCEGCEIDIPYCCSKYPASDPAVCGKRPLLFPGYQRTNFLPDGLSLPAVTAYGDGTIQSNDTALTPVEQSCFYGEEILFNNCDKTKVRCQLNPACNPSCVGNIPINSSGRMTAGLCTPGGNKLLTQDEMYSWYDPCPPPPPDKPGPDSGPHALSVYFRADDAVELYNAVLQSNGTVGICDPGTVCTTNTTPDSSGIYQNPKISLILGTDDYTQLLGMNSLNGKFSSTSGQCDSDTTPHHLQWWQKLLGIEGLPTFGADGADYFYKMYWQGPLMTHSSIPGDELELLALGPIFDPAPGIAWDHGFWGCSKSDNPVDYTELDKLLSTAVDIELVGWTLNWLFDYLCFEPYYFGPGAWCETMTEVVILLNYANSQLLAMGATMQEELNQPVQHPYDDHQWNNCDLNGGASSCPHDIIPTINYYHRLQVQVAPGTTTYLYMRLAEDDGPPYDWIPSIFSFGTILAFTSADSLLVLLGLYPLGFPPVGLVATPIITAGVLTSLNDTYGMFEVVAVEGPGADQHYCFRPYDTIFSQDITTPSYFPVSGVPGQNSCIYKVTHRDLEMDVTDELLVLDVPPNHGAPTGYIPYSCNSNECPGKCSDIGGAPLCQLRCDPGYAEVIVPDPNNPGNNIVTCLNCGDLKCDYTINCMQGGLLQSGNTVVASAQFIGASCENQDTLTSCVDTSTSASGHSVRQVGFNSCYATNGVGSTYPGTDPSQFGCQLSCHRNAATTDCK